MRPRVISTGWRTVLRPVVGMCFLCVAAGCGDSICDEGRSIELRVDVAHGPTSVTIDRVTYQISGAMLAASITGDLTLVEGEPLSSWSLIFDLPNGDYEMQLVVWDDAGEPFCTGHRYFGIHPTSEDVIDAIFMCLADPPVIGGGPDEEGQFSLIYGNLCPQDVDLAAVPREGTVGEPFDLVGSAVDREEEPLIYEWSVTAGTLSILTEGSATFVCDSPGVHGVTMNASDGDAHCEKQRTVDIRCTAP